MAALLHVEVFPPQVGSSMEEDESERGSTSASAVALTGADRSPMYIDMRT